VIWAVGRAPEHRGLGSTAAGVEVSQRHHPNRRYQNTNVDGIYAIGDITGRRR
jgi:glutathione reductase (NADPH)